MTHPGAHPRHDKSHEHIDLGQLMDGSSRGPGRADSSSKDYDERAEEDYGEETEYSGEAVGGYVSGQDEGSID
jgi:hypothetical protein